MTLERPMFPPSRRGFLSLAAGAAIVPATMAIPATANPWEGPYSPALVDASLVLHAAHEALQAAGVVYEAANAKAEAWERQHPQPKSRRGTRKWIQKAGKVHEAIVRPRWLDLLTAEQAFADAQVAFANVKPANEHDLSMMACHAVIYDEVELARRNTAPISRVVARDLLRLRVPGMA
jgi:hypothetical protein